MWRTTTPGSVATGYCTTYHLREDVTRSILKYVHIYEIVTCHYPDLFEQSRAIKESQARKTSGAMFQHGRCSGGAGYVQAIRLGE